MLVTFSIKDLFEPLIRDSHSLCPDNMGHLPAATAVGLTVIWVLLLFEVSVEIESIIVLDRIIVLCSLFKYIEMV